MQIFVISLLRYVVSSGVVVFVLLNLMGEIHLSHIAFDLLDFLL